MASCHNWGIDDNDILPLGINYSSAILVYKMHLYAYTAFCHTYMTKLKYKPVYIGVLYLNTYIHSFIAYIHDGLKYYKPTNLMEFETLITMAKRTNDGF